MVGQLIGMLSFSEGVLNSGLKSLKLKNEKFVIKSLGNIIMVSVLSFLESELFNNFQGHYILGMTP